MLLAFILMAVPLLLALASLPAHAKRLALVVGNAAYQGEGVLDLGLVLVAVVTDGGAAAPEGEAGADDRREAR